MLQGTTPRPPTGNAHHAATTRCHFHRPQLPSRHFAVSPLIHPPPPPLEPSNKAGCNL
jgi:hypothetical protein